MYQKHAMNWELYYTNAKTKMHYDFLIVGSGFWRQLLNKF